LTVQVPPAAIVPLLKVNDLRSPAMVNDPEPHPEYDVTAGETVSICAGLVGNVSLNVTFGRGLFWLGLEIMNDRVDVPPSRIGLVPNNFVMEGGCNTVMVSVPKPSALLLVMVAGPEPVS